jgi:hypothetical protein
MNDSFEPGPFGADPMEELRKLMEARVEEGKKRQKCFDEMNEELKGDEERVEKEVLMGLWSKVGNAPHTYFVAMKTIAQFMRALKRMRQIKGLPEDMHLLVLQSLAECVTLDARYLSVIIEKKAKFNIE